MVISLCGDWGTGKTSLKNMVLEVLRQGHASSPAIIEFNPWSWSGKERIHEAFFGEIGKALGKVDCAGERHQLARKWLVYSRALGSGDSLIRQAAQVIPGLLIAVGGIGLGGLLHDRSWLWGALGGVTVVLGAIGASLRWAGDFAAKVADTFAASADFRRKGAEEQKAELRADLQCMPNPLLVVIDDIDRLSRSEIRMLFRLVKANADFPNIVYLLLFQRDVVERSLGTRAVDGRDFLGKIVQVPFDIPALPLDKVHGSLTVGLNKALADVPDTLVDADRWARLFHEGIGGYFTTLRDVNRFLNAFAVHVEQFRGPCAFEVDPVDLIGVEVLRVFEPDLYQGIAASGDLLTGPAAQGGVSEEVKAQVQALVGLAHGGLQGHAQAILTTLFPIVSLTADGGGTLTSSGTDGATRICRPNAYPRYFRLRVPEGTISQSDIVRFVGLAGNGEALREYLDGFERRRLLSALLDQVATQVNTIPWEHARSFVAVLANLGDRLSRDREGPLSISPFWSALLLVMGYVDRAAPNQGERESMVRALVKECRGLALLGALLQSDEQTRGKGKGGDACLFSNPSFDELKKAFVQRVREQAEQDAVGFAQSASFSVLLYLWRRWGSEDEPRRFVVGLITSDDGLLAFISGFVSTVQSWSSEDYLARTRRQAHLSSMLAFASLEVLESRVAELDRSGLTDGQAAAMKAFTDALARHRAGRPEDPFFDSEADRPEAPMGVSKSPDGGA